MTTKPTIDQILKTKPEARPRIYAYAIDDAAHAGLLKVGQTARDVKQRVAEQLKTAAIKNYRIELDEPAERENGSLFSDHGINDSAVHIKFLRTLQDLRSVSAAHRKGSKYKKLVNQLQLSDDGQQRVFGSLLSSTVEFIRFLRTNLISWF